MRNIILIINADDLCDLNLYGVNIRMSAGRSFLLRSIRRFVVQNPQILCMFIDNRHNVML